MKTLLQYCKRFSLSNLRQQMTLILIVVITLPLTFVGWILIQSSQKSLKTSLSNAHQRLVVQSSHQIHEYMERPRALLENSSSILGTLRSDVWKHETVLVEMGLNHDIFGRICSIDSKGMEIASSEPDTDLVKRVTDPAYMTSIKGDFYMSPIYFEIGLPKMIMSIPIRSLGKVVGVLMAEVNLREIWHKVDAIQIGDTGRAFLVDVEGRLVAHQDKKRVLMSQNYSTHPAIIDLKSNGTGAGEYSLDENNVVCAYALIPGVRWGLVFQQSAKEAYYLIQQMKTRAMLLIAAGIALAVFFSIILAAKLVHPVRVLGEKIKQLSKGNYNFNLRVKRNDELGNLMQSINRISNQLKNSKGDEKMAVVGKATAGIAHELKNSLVMANTLIKLFPKRYKDTEFIKKFSNIVPKELDNWNSLLRELSDYCKPNEFETVELRLNPLLDDFILLISDKLYENKIQLNAQFESDLPPIEGNLNKIKQVLMNLVLNAVEAMDQGGVLSIRAKTTPSDTDLLGSAFVQIDISDNGKGMKSEVLEKIFTPFHTTKRGGLGVGLSITKTIIEAHGGKIQIQSQYNQGTMASIWLPCKALIHHG